MTLEYKLVTDESATFEIYDVAGRLVKQQLLNAQNTIANIDATILNAGVYYYKIKTENKQEKAEKLVIVK